MATTKLIIKRNKLNKEGKTAIYIQYCYLSKTTLFSTGEKIDPQLWDGEKGKLRKSKKTEYLVTLDAVIRKKQAKIEDLVRKIKFEGLPPTAELIRERIEGTEKSEPVDEIKVPTFFEVIENFMETNRNSRSTGTIKGYRSALTHLKTFQKQQRRKITFEQMNQDFYNRYCNYLFEKKAMSSNTVGRYIKTLKVFLNYAADQGMPVNPSFRKFKVLKEDIDIVYLNESELAQLRDLDLTENTRLRHVRDVFLFACYTGLRYSDVLQVKPAFISERRLSIQTQKTRDRLLIPLIPQARKILDRYSGQYPNSLPVISSQKMNVYLKELAVLAALDTPVSITRHFGKKKVEETLPKHQLITTHTARRTFITLSLEKGIRPEVLMKITGHKDYDTLKSYIKIVDKVKEEEMLKAWG